MEDRLAKIKVCLRQIPLFQPLSEDELSELAVHVRVEKHTEEQILFHQGDAGDSFYIVNEGQVELTIMLQDKEKKGRKIRKLIDSGGSFGEMSLLTGAQRAADAKVFGSSELFVIEKAPFRELLLAHDAVASELGATMLRLLTSNQLSEQNNTESENASSGERPPSVIISDTEDSLLEKIKSFFSLG